MTIDDAFNKTSDYYDSWVQKALICYDELFSVAVECIPFSVSEKLKILDLGAGTGLFSWHVLQRHTNADFTLIDVADKMLDISKERFASHEGQFSYIKSDYRKLILSSPFDLIISSLSIHHLNDKEKQDLFREICLKLKPGGAFINVDQIKAPSEHFQELYWSIWLSEVRKTGASEKQIKESILRRKDFDKDSTLIDQLEWLKKAGFKQVDCLYKRYFVGVFFAQK